MTKFIFILIVLFSVMSLMTTHECKAKKIKTSYKISKSAMDKDWGISDKDSTIMVTASQNGITISYEGKNIFFVSDSIRFAGFDKNINSSKESFLIINNSEVTVNEVFVKLTYNDIDGGMLHSRKYNIKCKIPPGETRLADIPSWDCQHTYYYYLSNPPKKVAVPFKVEITPIQFIIQP